MPYYDYRCERCSTVTSRKVAFEDRLEGQQCPCGSVAAYQFPVSAALGFQPFESYYDEALDGDITGRQDKKRFLKANGLIEAGDKVHGARNFDKTAPDHIKPLPPRGVSVWANQGKQAAEKELLNKRREAAGD